MRFDELADIERDLIPENDDRVRYINPQPIRSSSFFAAASFARSLPKPREFLVDQLIPTKTVTMFSGDGGTGKSLLALMLAVSVATGRSWLGNSVEVGSAVYVSAEDDADEIHRRIDDITRASGIEVGNLNALSLRSLAGEDALLALEGPRGLQPSPLFGELERHCQQFEPSFVVLDTLAELFPSNENDRAAARQFIGILRGLAIRHNCAVVLLSHPSLTGLNSGSGSSGSTGWNNSVRSRLYLSRVVDNGYEADPDRRVLRTMKANYGRVGGEISMRWKSGCFEVEAKEGGLDALASSSKAERLFLHILDQHRDCGIRVSQAGGRNFAPNLFAAHPDADGVTRAGFKGAMAALFAKGSIKIAEDGPPSKRRTFIARG